MFDPLDFLQLARMLANEAANPASRARDARLRTAYSRAYYGLYLHVRALIVQRHNIPVRHLKHGDLYSRLQYASSPKPLRRLGSELQRLYRLRQTADYELGAGDEAAGDLHDAAVAAYVAGRALELANSVDDLDFTPVVHHF
jgi:uncharacterized protein (UPF0332 family)